MIRKISDKDRAELMTKALRTWQLNMDNVDFDLTTLKKIYPRLNLDRFRAEARARGISTRKDRDITVAFSKAPAPGYGQRPIFLRG